MPNAHETLTSLFSDIADAIRAKEGILDSEGNHIIADTFPDRIAALPSGGGATVEPLSVTTNGTYTAPSGTAYSPVNVSVANSYSASDEGKVVDSGALVAQTSRTISNNGTYDTTTNNSITVSVSGGADSYTYTTFNIGDSDVWTSDQTSGGYYHDYTVSGVTSSSSPVLTPIISDASTVDTISRVWGTVFMATTDTDTIRLYAVDPITTAMTIAVKGY